MESHFRPRQKARNKGHGVRLALGASDSFNASRYFKIARKIPVTRNIRQPAGKLKNRKVIG